MTRRLFLTGVLCLSLAAIAAAQPGAQKPAPRIRYVILVSVDGLMPAAYLSPDAHGLQVPTLRELARQGAWSDGAKSVFPTVTYPAHTSIATGVNPGTHGIVTNEALDPVEQNDAGWRWYTEDIRTATLWDAARKRGLRTALVWWPVTVGARGTVVVPEIWRSGTPEDVKLARALATPGILDAVEKRFPNFLAGFTPPEVKDESLTDIAVQAIETVRPHLLMLHIFEVDAETHDHGPWSPEANAAIENADRQIARLIAAAKKAGIWEQTALVLVSDHGFLPITERVRPGVLLRAKGLVTLDERNRVADWKAILLKGGAHAYIYLKDPADQEARRILLDTLLPLAGKPGSGIGRVYTEEEIRKRGGDPAAFLALEGAEGFDLQGGYAGDYISPTTKRGTHGYDAERPELRASFVAYGPAIAPGKLATEVKLIDVAPTVAAWLGLKLASAQGRALPIRTRTPGRQNR